MKLTRISASNLKGASFGYDLTEAVAIVGPNFSGKTAIVEAIRLLFKGYIPEIGKRSSSTWELSSGMEIKVTGVFDDGAEILRSWRLEGAKMIERFDGPLLLGDVFENLPLLDAGAYFEMTDSERVQYVFERVKLPDSYTPEAIISEVERISFGEEHTETIEKAKAEHVKEVRDIFEQQPKLQEALTVMVMRFRETFSYWNKRAKETQGAVKTLTELKLREKQEAFESVKEIEANITAAQDKLDKLNGVKGRLRAQQDEAQRATGRKKQIQRILDEDRIDYGKVFVDLRRKVAEAKIVPVQNKEEWEKDRQSRHKLVETISNVRAGIEQQRKNVQAAQAQLFQLEELKACPFCKSKGKDWKSNLEKELNHTVETQTKLRSDGAKYVEDLTDQLVKMSKRKEQGEKDYAANAETLKQIDQWQAEIQRQLTAKTREEERYAALQEELKRLDTLPIDKELAQGLAEIEEQLQFNSGLRDGLTARKKAALALQQDLKRAAEAQLEHQSADAHVRVIKEIAGAIKQKREAMTHEAFDSLLGTANKLVVGILKSPLALYENTVGRWEGYSAFGAKFIPHRVFSGVEKKLTFVAIAAALSAQAPLRLMLVDELGLATKNVQRKVLLSLKKALTEKLIDQVIVVIPSDEKLEFPGWNVVWLP